MLDFGLFSFIQCLQNQTNSTDVEDLASIVAEAFQETSFITLDRVWLSLVRYIGEVVKVMEKKSTATRTAIKGKLDHSPMSVFKILIAKQVSTAMHFEVFPAPAQLEGCISWFLFNL